MLDPQDLTDEALFRLITTDDSIRAMVTREIEERGYVRVKPTRRELESEQQIRMLQGSDADEALLTGDLRGKNQEDTYWSRPRQGYPNGGPLAPGAVPPSAQPQAPTPANPPDRRRAIEQAQAQAQVGDYYTGLPLDVVGMQRVSPEAVRAAALAWRIAPVPVRWQHQIRAERMREYLLRWGWAPAQAWRPA